MPSGGLPSARTGGARVTASADQTARLWDAHTGKLLAVLGGHTGRVGQALFSPNGTRVVSASEDGTLRLWDSQTGELIGVLRGHGDVFNGAPVFTPDGSRLVSGSTDGTVRIWDMRLVERNGILSGHESYVYDVAFKPQRRAGGVGGVGRHRTPLGRHDRPSDRSAEARDGDDQLGGLQP